MYFIASCWSIRTMECAECVASWLVGACLVLRKTPWTCLFVSTMARHCTKFGMVEPISDALTLFLEDKPRLLSEYVYSTWLEDQLRPLAHCNCRPTNTWFTRYLLSPQRCWSRFQSSGKWFRVRSVKISQSFDDFYCSRLLHLQCHSAACIFIETSSVSTVYSKCTQHC
jgi:hypothetical protein